MCGIFGFMSKGATTGAHPAGWNEALAAALDARKIAAYPDRFRKPVADRGIWNFDRGRRRPSKWPL